MITPRTYTARTPTLRYDEVQEGWVTIAEHNGHHDFAFCRTGVNRHFHVKKTDLIEMVMTTSSGVARQSGGAVESRVWRWPPSNLVRRLYRELGFRHEAVSDPPTALTPTVYWWIEIVTPGTESTLCPHCHCFI
jgi:hypothetical protein